MLVLLGLLLAVAAWTLPANLKSVSPALQREVRGLADSANTRGDLVLSKTGELLGIMVNSDYCAVVSNFSPAGKLTTGEDVTAQKPAELLGALSARVRARPLKLQ